MKIQGKFITMLMAGLIALVATMGVIRAGAVGKEIEKTQEHMADEVLRFHVLANSNSKEDQQLKMKVKDGVIDWMEAKMDRETDTLEETRNFIRGHKKEIRHRAEEIIRAEGYDYPVKVSLENTEFPEKTYGDVTFPAGTYEALRIQIGEAKGHNWWCVLYPNLCFIDSVHAVVPEKGKKQLKHVLTEEEYDMVTATSKFKVKWFFFGSEDK
nr:stage II sporulation protein R [uncultured Sellimonas sp.]